MPPLEDTNDIQIDMGSAVSDIGSGLGLDLEGGDDGQNDDNDQPGNAPASGAAASPVPGQGNNAPAGVVPPSTIAGAPPATAPVGTAPAVPGDPAAAPLASGELPKTWKPELAPQWAALDPAVKAEVLRREEDMFRGLEGYKVDAAQGRSFKQAMAPYDPILRTYGLDPVVQAGKLMQAHFTLATGTPQVKAEFMRDLIRNYQIDPQLLYGQQGAPGSAQPDGYSDPAVASLQQQIAALQSEREAEKRTALVNARADLERQYDAFAANKANVHLNDVLGEMVQMIQSGASATLEDAYAKAVWLNPKTRAVELANQQKELDKQREAENTARIAAAKKATEANVRTRAKSGSAAAPLGSMDDTLAATMAEIQARG